MSESRVDEDAVRHVAELANVDLSDEDVDRFRSEFVDILEYFERLEDVPEIDGKGERLNVLRSDRVEPSLPQEDALENAEETEDGYFKGPPVS